MKMNVRWFCTVLFVILAVCGGFKSTVAQSTTAGEVQQAREQVENVLAKVKSAFDQSGGNPQTFIDALPPEVRQGNEDVYRSILALRPGESTTQFRTGQPADPVRPVFDRQAAALAQRYEPTRNPQALASDAATSTAQGSTNSAYFKGHFLNPILPPPYGLFTPNCENNWCMPDLYIKDYDQTDLDGRWGNYCNIVPDFWFRRPCYQHDLGFTFAPMATDTKLGSFLAINWQWYGEMRDECSAQISFDWLNPEFYMCQAVAFTYWFAVNTVAFPIFNSPDQTKGYDVLTGDNPNTTHPPVYRRWSACTGKYIDSRPFVSYNRVVLGDYASVPQGAILELSGRAHRGTPMLFEFVDQRGMTVANHLTAKATDNCVILQEPETFDTSVLPGGGTTYTVKARYYAWEPSGYKLDWEYNPPEYVTYGAPTYNEHVMTLQITGGSDGGTTRRRTK